MIERLQRVAWVAGVAMLTAAAGAGAQEPAGPGLASPTGPGLERPKPDLSDMERIRFVTDDDYPPFNYRDEDGALTGFNVDLARAICEELSVECEVRAMPWESLLPALAKEEADAAVASMRSDGRTLSQADFTEGYYHTPARFVARKDSPLDDVNPEALEGRTIGVIQDTTHELFLRTFYPTARITAFADADAARQALREGKVELLFGDGISLMFWLNGTASNGCCEFRGGAYSEPRYFGDGIGIAVRRGNRKLREALEYGLDQVRASGRFEELLLRYFPMSVF